MSISKAEWEIMRVVWTKEETTSSQLLAILGEKNDWTASTIKTLLKRLVDKGFLSRQKLGKRFLYSSKVSEQEVMNQQADDLFSKFCQRKHVAILKHLLKEVPVTDSDIDDLQALLLSKRKETVDEVPCNCIPGQCRCKEHLEL